MRFHTRIPDKGPPHTIFVGPMQGKNAEKVHGRFLSPKYDTHTVQIIFPSPAHDAKCSTPDCGYGGESCGLSLRSLSSGIPTKATETKA